MQSKRKLLNRSRLYLILDTQVATRSKLFEIAKKALKAGVDIIQLRDKIGPDKDTLKYAKKLAALAKGKKLFIVNDRIDIALLSGADGVHLGQDDLNVSMARKFLGKKAIIGQSCQTLEHLRQTNMLKSDYVGFGSVFKTLTKPKRRPMELNKLKKAYKNFKKPFFAIGGIDLSKAKFLKSIGMDRLAVCRYICLAKNVSKAVTKLKKLGY